MLDFQRLQPSVFSGMKESCAIDYGYGEPSKCGKNPKRELGEGDVYSVDRYSQDMVAGQRDKAPDTSHLGEVCRGISCQVFPRIGEVGDAEEIFGITTRGSNCGCIYKLVRETQQFCSNFSS